MWEHLLRYFEILKTVPEIKESIEELKFGCNFIYEWWEYSYCTFFSSWEVNTTECRLPILSFDEAYKIKSESKQEIIFFNNLEKAIINRMKIIWQIHEWHLRMFLDKNKNKNIKIDTYWRFYNNIWEVEFQLNNTKDHTNQSEEFYKKLGDWLIKEFNIKL